MYQFWLPWWRPVIAPLTPPTNDIMKNTILNSLCLTFLLPL
ncbi:uncharacterized protein METZ01_LOCUS404719, partial [marine metagenome]